MAYPFTPDRPLWLLGCGNMAGAMLSRWRETGLDERAYRIVDTRHMLPDDPPPAALLLGVKPQVFDAATPDPARLAGSDTVVLSIMAGITGERLAARFPANAGIVRLMPNLPVALGKGVVLMREVGGGAPAKAVADALAAPLGLAAWIDGGDARFDAATTLSGCGPAFVYRFTAALAKAGAPQGLDAAQALRLATATVEGAAALAAMSGEAPGTLADKVASKGGVTRAGLDVLDRELDDLLARVFEAAGKRSAELAAE